MCDNWHISLTLFQVYLLQFIGCADQRKNSRNALKMTISTVITNS
jgi:hypothetical protein